MQPIKVYVFITGFSPDHGMYTSCALTEHGKWLAGAVARTDFSYVGHGGEGIYKSSHEVTRERVLVRCQLMAIEKAKTMLSSPVEVVIKTTIDSEVESALAKAFERLP